MTKTILKCATLQITWANLFWIVTTIIITGTSYTVLYCLVGSLMLPGGSAFGLYIIIVSAYFLGWALTYIPYLHLPPVFGMLLAGIIIRNTHLFNIEEEFGFRTTAKIRLFCMAFITIRMGLQLTTSPLREHPVFVMILALVPCTMEMLSVSVCAKFLLGYPWNWAFLTG